MTDLDRVEHIMGMPIGIDVRDSHLDPAVLDRAFDWLRWVDATYSTYKPDSEICRLNRGEIVLADAHPDVRAVLQRCEELRFETGGYFDIRSLPLPPEAGIEPSSRSLRALDPSGFVKGWSVDRAAAILQDAGAENFCINAGGDVRVLGHAIPEPHWRIGIQHPLSLQDIAAVVVANDLAIATSGTYRRGQHIIDPHTGDVPEGILSVTIVGPDLGTADAFATAAFAMGPEGPAWTTQLPGYEAMTILADETVLSTSGFPTSSMES